MTALTAAEWEVLNASSDDFENLEQIYQSVCFEFSSDNYDPSEPAAFWLRNRLDAPTLAEVADAIKILLGRGLLEGRTENGSLVTGTTDSAVVWTGWFHTTKDGQALLSSPVLGDSCG